MNFTLTCLYEPRSSGLGKEQHDDNLNVGSCILSIAVSPSASGRSSPILIEDDSPQFTVIDEVGDEVGENLKSTGKVKLYNLKNKVFISICPCHEI